MTKAQFLLDAGPQGGALNNTNSGSVTASPSGVLTTYDSAMAAHGPFGGRFPAAAGSHAYRRWPLDAPAKTHQFSAVVTLPARPPSGTTLTIASAANQSGAGRVVFYYNSAGAIGLRGRSSSELGVIVTNRQPGEKVRLTANTIGGSATASEITAKAYVGANGSWNTQVGSTLHTTTADTGTDDVVGWDLGILSTQADAYTIGWDDIQLNDGPGPEIGDIIERLPEPDGVTLGATTHPSPAGASNGTQVITWTVEPGVTYVSRLADTLTPVEDDFDDVTVGVTSPYTFTGLGAGPYSFGVKAKA